MNPLDVRLADKRRKLTIMMITSEDLTIFACKDGGVRKGVFAVAVRVLTSHDIIVHKDKYTCRVKSTCCSQHLGLREDFHNYIILNCRGRLENDIESNWYPLLC